MELSARGTLAILSLGAVSWNSLADPAYPDRRLTSIRSQRSNQHRGTTRCFKSMCLLRLRQDDSENKVIPPITLDPWDSQQHCDAGHNGLDYSDAGLRVRVISHLDGYLKNRIGLA